MKKAYGTINSSVSTLKNLVTRNEDSDELGQYDKLEFVDVNENITENGKLDEREEHTTNIEPSIATRKKVNGS